MRQVTEIPKLKPRAKDSHKGNFGRIFVIAGNRTMSGAAAMIGMACLKSGAGLVRIGVPESILPIVAAIEPAYITVPLSEDETGHISSKALSDILKAAEENDFLAIGPGLGRTAQIRFILEKLLGIKDLTMVIDADGLNNLSAMRNWDKMNKARLILTPHPGEMKRLWSGLFREQMPEDRIKQAATLARKVSSVVVLKGANTVVTDGDKYYVNQTGNPGMATAGSGDSLTGMITGLLGQGLDRFEAAMLGVYLHGAAGDIAAEELGQVSVTATDIIKYIPKAFLGRNDG